MNSDSDTSESEEGYEGQIMPYPIDVTDEGNPMGISIPYLIPEN